MNMQNGNLDLNEHFETESNNERNPKSGFLSRFKNKTLYFSILASGLMTIISGLSVFEDFGKMFSIIRTRPSSTHEKNPSNDSMRAVTDIDSIYGIDHYMGRPSQSASALGQGTVQTTISSNEENDQRIRDSLSKYNNLREAVLSNDHNLFILQLKVSRLEDTLVYISNNLGNVHEVESLKNNIDRLQLKLENTQTLLEKYSETNKWIIGFMTSTFLSLVIFFLNQNKKQNDKPVRTNRKRRTTIRKAGTSNLDT